MRVADPDGALTRGAHRWLGLLVVTAMLIAGVVFLKEGGVCTILASPIFYAVGIVSAASTGRMLRESRARRPGTTVASLAIWPLPFLLMQPMAGIVWPARIVTVTSLRMIDAAPGRAWPALTQVRHIRGDELGWTFTQDVGGVPKPTDARLEGSGIGPVRHVRWGERVRFDEVVTQWEPGRRLGWRFAFDDRWIPGAIDAHLRPDSEYLTVIGGEYMLWPAGEGRTELTLRTRYRLRTALNGYGAWCGERFVGDFHTNVLRVIAGRVERGVVAAGGQARYLGQA